MTAAGIRKAGEELARRTRKTQRLPAEVVDELARILEAVAERLKREDARRDRVVERRAAS